MLNGKLAAGLSRLQEATSISESHPLVGEKLALSFEPLVVALIEERREVCLTPPGQISPLDINVIKRLQQSFNGKVGVLFLFV